MVHRFAARLSLAATEVRSEYWGPWKSGLRVCVSMASKVSDSLQGLEPPSSHVEVAVISLSASPAPSTSTAERSSLAVAAVRRLDDGGTAGTAAAAAAATAATLAESGLGSACAALADTAVTRSRPLSIALTSSSTSRSAAAPCKSTSSITARSVPVVTPTRSVSTSTRVSTTMPTSTKIPMSTTTATSTSTTSIPTSTARLKTSTTTSTTSTPSSTARLKTSTTTSTTSTPSSTAPAPPATRRSFTAAHFSETEYLLEGGLRRVRPYYADTTARCKARWLGLSLRQVYEREFHSETVASYEAACALGRLTLNGRRTRLEALLRDGDTIRLRAHRHEPAVSSRPAVLVAQDEGYVAVNKPASLPVHPCGRYRHSSLLFVLAKECGLSGLHTLYRLDRLASGLVVFAKSKEASRRVDEQIRQRLVHKEYVCRVAGEFPAGEVVCEEPLSVVEGRLGVSRVDRLAGKPSRSLFRLLRYDAGARAGGSSLLSCVPVTGRSHQLRVHLRSLGFPVLLDPVYGSPAWADGAPLADVLRRIADETCEPSARSLVARLGAGERPPGTIPPAAIAGDGPTRNGDAGGAGDGDDRGGARGDAGVASGAGMAEVVWPERDPICSECWLQRPDPRPRDLGMCLHALRYSGPGWAFEVPMPDWAAPDWTEDMVAF